MTVQFVVRVRQLHRLLESLTGHKLSDPVTQAHSVIHDGLPGKDMVSVQTPQHSLLAAHSRFSHERKSEQHASVAPTFHLLHGMNQLFHECLGYRSFQFPLTSLYAEKLRSRRLMGQSTVVGAPPPLSLPNIILCLCQ